MDIQSSVVSVPGITFSIITRKMSSYQQLPTLFTSHKHTHMHGLGILEKPIEWNPHLHFRFDGHNQEAPAFSPQSAVDGIQYYQYLARRQSQVMN